jgi:AraC-like DNA-binding protein
MKLNDLDNEFNYFARNENKVLGFSVNCVGFQSIPPKAPYPLDGHPQKYMFNVNGGRTLSEYQLVYITDGAGIFKTEHSDCAPISAGQIVLIRPNQWHFYCPNNDTGWDEYFVGFCSDIFDNVLEDSISKIDNQIINVGLNVELADLFRRAIEISRSERIPFQEHLQGIVVHIIGLILTASQRKNETNEHSQQIIEKAKILMSENIFANFSPVELARQLDMNYVTFRRLFRTTTGVAPAKYLMALKMKKAKEILLSASFTVKKISSDLCFDSPDSFNKAFKKSTGQTATEYRLNSKMTV